MSRLAVHARSVDLERVDWLLAGLLILDQILESALLHHVPSDRRLVTAIGAALFVAPVAGRRRWPIGAALACPIVAVAQLPLHTSLFALASGSAAFAPILISYGVGAWLDLRRSLIGQSLAAGLLFTDQVLGSSVFHAAGTSGGVGNALGVLLFLYLIPWVLGRVVHERHRRAEAFEALERQTLAEQEERARAAVAEERVIIGRELQDIIAHSVSLMVVQAGGARAQLTAHPHEARESILNVERTGREALAEMRRLLGVLRRDDDPRALAPQPGLGQLAELVERLAGRGLAVELAGACTPGLTPGVDLVAYRVIEAALEDAASHGGRDATVTLGDSAGVLDVEVRSDGSGAGLADRLAGIGERVALYDGRLDVIDDVLVRCRLPLGAAVAA
jgi:signal transduction histidine kinase